MALWLFRRRTKRKRSRSGAQPGDDAPLPRSQTSPPDRTETGGGNDAPARHTSFKKQRTEPSRLQRRARTYSFDSGGQDEIRIARNRSVRNPVREAAPPPRRFPGANPVAPSDFNATTTISDEEKKELGLTRMVLDDDAALYRAPTLYANKRDGNHLMGRKLSKRRKNSHDREREAELKALRDFAPLRPATDAWTAGRPMKKDSRRVKSGFSVRHPWDKEQHPSDVSLPIPSSIHSTLSSDSEQISYKVSAFAVLAPKPTLRCTIYPRWGQAQPGAANPTRSGSQKRKFSDRAPIPESTLKAHKRVDDLADDLSASDLRALMERDKRRRERKRELEQEKIEKKLARRAEKERRAAAEGRESPPNLERGILGRESVGLGIEATSAVVTSSRRRSSSTASAKQLGKLPADEGGRELGANVTKDGDLGAEGPLHVFHRINSIPLEPSSPTKEGIGDVTPLRLAQTPQTKRFLRLKKSRSKSPLSEPEHSDVSGTPRKTSESSSKGPISWTSIFRWGLRAKRSSGPSSFSNTSRDSMSTQPQSAPPPNVTFVPPGSSGRGPSVPKRTRSRFREDLPELPLSPPDPRLQSPEHDNMPPVIMEQDSPSLETSIPTHPTTPIAIPGARSDTPISDGMRRTPTSLLREGEGPSLEPQMSMSLASIDSEASWLSGRLRDGRLSSQMRKRGDSNPSEPYFQTSASGGLGESAEGTDQNKLDEDVAGVADEYLNRVAQPASEAESSSPVWAGNRKSTGEAKPSRDEDYDTVWGAVPGKQPTVVQGHIADRIKSREGLLNTFGDEDGGESEVGTLDSPISLSASAGEKDDLASLQRARSVNIGQAHARCISAGSAKLLNITPRTSTDIKRRSSDKRVSQLAE